VSRKSLRKTLAMLWLSFIISTSAMVLVAPHIVSEIGQNQIFDAFTSVMTIWFPVTTFFLAFWFSRNGGQVSTNGRIGSERYFAAIACTSIYVAIFLFLIFRTIYIHDYKALDYQQLGDLQEGLSFQEQIEKVTKLAVLLSVLVTAPVAWATGKDATVPKEK
jgi:hypothetical protein